MLYYSYLDFQAGIEISLKVESERIGSTFRAGGEISEIGENFSGYLSAIRILQNFSTSSGVFLIWYQPLILYFCLLH